MAFTLDATVGGASANSYLTEAAATALVETLFDTTAWEDAEAGQRPLALAATTHLLEAETPFGLKATTTQRLKWPRTGVYDEDGVAYDSTTIPEPVQVATMELALAILRGDVALEESSGYAGIKSLRIGPVSLGVTGTTAESGKLPLRVRRAAGRLYRTMGVGGMVWRG